MPTTDPDLTGALVALRDAGLITTHRDLPESGSRAVGPYDPENKPPFEVWLARVDSRMMRRFGLDTACLPDADYWSIWESGTSPAQAVRDVTAENGYQY